MQLQKAPLRPSELHQAAPRAALRRAAPAHLRAAALCAARLAHRAHPPHRCAPAALRRDQPQGFPFEGYDLEELILPDGDDMGIRSDEDESEDEDIDAETGFGSVIVVDNLPAVPEEKYEKLANVLKKIYGQIGNIRDGARRRWRAAAC